MTEIWIVLGVAPVQYPILKRVTSDPAIDSAVQTTPPIRRTESIPDGPVTPIRDSTTAEMISVVNVIPETGVMLIVAMAQADTDAKRNETTSVSTSAATERVVA